MKRAIFLIGIPGSGKSFFVKEFLKQGFVVINADDLRKQYLNKLRVDKKQIRVNDNWVEPCPDNAEQIFSREMVAMGYELSFFAMSNLTNENHNIVVDMTNITLKRVPLMALAHARGYSVEAYVFLTQNVEFNNSNINLRKQSGGLVLKENNEEQMSLLNKMKNEMDIHLKSIKVNSSYASNKIWHWNELPEWIKTGVEDGSNQNEIALFQEHDVFHEKRIIQVQSYQTATL